MSESSGHNAIAAIKEAKHTMDSSYERAYDTTLAPGLATNATVQSEAHTKRVVLDTYEIDPTKCVECGAPGEFACRDCADTFCQPCYQLNHRRGKRVMHKFEVISAPAAIPAPVSEEADSEKSKGGFLSSLNPFKSKKADKDAPARVDAGEWWAGRQVDGDWFTERAKYIPLRLTHEERRYLRLLEGVLRASGYTDKVDMTKHKSRKDRVRKSAQEVLAVLQALVAHADIDCARELMQTGDFGKFAVFFQHVFEVGRRHKIRNPDKMQSTYGPLLWLLQDSQVPEVRDLLGFSCVRPVYTVHALLEERGGLALLRDPMLPVATQEVLTAGKARAEVEAVSRRKARALESLLATHAHGALSSETVKLAVFSIADNHAHLRCTRDPCNELLGLLRREFSKEPSSADSQRSLAIVGGSDGSRLTHPHRMQVHYVSQSLLLWRDILDDCFRLWSLSEQDLLDTAAHPYELTETGQGVHRLQQAPRTDRALRHIVCRVQSSAGTWVGSSVIHLGDRNVPNSLVFVDKYNQVGKILQPLCVALRNMDRLRDHSYASVYLAEHYGGDVDKAKLDVLADFFRHAFDGSGSDNFFEAGSCIDGRLTSAWEWCNTVTASSNLKRAGKKYFPLLQMADFVGFDGDEWD